MNTYRITDNATGLAAVGTAENLAFNLEVMKADAPAEVVASIPAFLAKLEALEDVTEEAAALSLTVNASTLPHVA